MSKRKSVSKRTRFEVFKRDEFTCQYCGKHPPSVVLEVDHIVAVANGGCNETDNLVTSCYDCNRGKSSIPLTSSPQSLRDKAKKISESEEQLRGYYDVIQAKKHRIEAEIWAIVRQFLQTEEPQISIRRDWYASIKMFIDRLGFYEVQDAMDIALSKSFRGDRKIFLYFCGVCWRKIKDAQNG